MRDRRLPRTAKSWPISDKCAKRRSCNYRVYLSLVVPLFRKSVQKSDAMKKEVRRAANERVERSTVPAAEVHFTHSRAYAPLCSSGAALREVLCAVQRSLRPARSRSHSRETRARAYTHTAETWLPPLHTYTVTSCVALMYKGRSMWLTCSHMLPADSVSLARPPTVDLSSFPSASYSIYSSLSLSLSFSLVHIYHTHAHATHTYRVSLFLLSVLFSLSVNVSIPLHRWSVHIARSRYTRQSAHTRPRRVHAGVGHVRDALFARGATFAFYASCARGAALELYTLFSDLLRRAFRYTPLNKSNRKTATDEINVCFS